MGVQGVQQARARSCRSFGSGCTCGAKIEMLPVLL